MDGRRPIRVAVSIAIFRIIVAMRTLVIIRTLDLIPGLVPVLCSRLGIPLGTGTVTAKCGSMAWVVLCTTVTV